MGVLPVQFKAGEGRQALNLTGDEIVDLSLPAGVSEITPRQDLILKVTRADGSSTEAIVMSRLDTENEIAYFESGGILQYVLNNLVEAANGS
jgi:aconitate hydratase